MHQGQFSDCFLYFIKEFSCVIIIIIISFFASFSHQQTLVVFHKRLCDSKSSQVFRTLLSILINLNNLVDFMVLILSLVSNSFKAFGDCSKRTNNNWCHLGVPQHFFFLLSMKIQVFIHLFILFPLFGPLKQ